MVDGTGSAIWGNLGNAAVWNEMLDDIMRTVTLVILNRSTSAVNNARAPGATERPRSISTVVVTL